MTRSEAGSKAGSALGVMIGSRVLRTAVAAVGAALEAVRAHLLRLPHRCFGVCQAGVVLDGRTVDLPPAAAGCVGEQPQGRSEQRTRRFRLRGLGCVSEAEASGCAIQVPADCRSAVKM